MASTYGRSQTTLASGSLYLLIKAYFDSPDAQFAARLSPYLGRLSSQDTPLDTDMTFRGLLRDAGDDPGMHTVQDQFFNRVCWNHSQKDTEATSVLSMLGTTVVYDSHVHGSWRRIRDLTIQNHGEHPALGKEDWIGFYVSLRRNWLATNPNPALHATVYHMDTFDQLMGTQN